MPFDQININTVTKAPFSRSLWAADNGMYSFETDTYNYLSSQKLLYLSMKLVESSSYSPTPDMPLDDNGSNVQLFLRWPSLFGVINPDEKHEDNNHHHHHYHHHRRIQRHNSRLLTIFSLPCELSPTHTLQWPERNCVQTMYNTSSAYHMQHVVLCATWYEGTAQLLSLTEFKSHLF